MFFGWPVTTIRPSRPTSTPTWSMEVAKATSVGRSPPTPSGRWPPVSLKAARIAADRAEVRVSGSNGTLNWRRASVM